MSNIHDVVAIIFAINEVIESVTRQHEIFVMSDVLITWKRGVGGIGSAEDEYEFFNCLHQIMLGRGG